MKISETNIQFLAGVGERKAAVLKEELGISSFEDMLYHFPYRYIDRSRIYPIKSLRTDMPYIQIKARISDFRTVGKGRQKRLTAIARDESGIIELVWFKGIKYIPAQVVMDTEYLIFGRPSVFNGKLNMVHPEFDIYDKVKNHLVGYQPLYNTSEKMKKASLNSRGINRIVYNIFTNIQGRISEKLPASFINEKGLMLLHDALYNIHFPSSGTALNKAVYRLKFEELFYIQLHIQREKFRRKTVYKGHPFKSVGKNFNRFYRNLPFELTRAQKQVIREIRRDCGGERQMNRLLQGDVGSGKTLVALMAMLLACDNGYQACIMAPTEILANQHYRTLLKFTDGLPVTIALLTGSTSQTMRKSIHEGLEDGSLHILVGTHALLEDNVVFDNLGLVVIDEQHRFGVAQRAKLWVKNQCPPHMLIMTATPIPRTLAMTLYGDLDISVIDELPPGRKPITTVHAFENKRKKVFDFIAGEIARGRQAYIVYPLIHESEKQDMQNLEKGFETVNEYFRPLGYKTGIVHGKLKAEEKQEEITRFLNKETHILLSTTVIEVGVDIPNASVMVIENAERFGLSQLHQLRGRIGRGAEKSYCILMTSYEISAYSRKRIECMIRTNDGFEIAEADLKLRGPGDIDGTRQSGAAFNLRISNLARDGHIMEEAEAAAREILEDDPLLEKDKNHIYAEQLKKLFRLYYNWKAIG